MAPKQSTRLVAVGTFVHSQTRQELEFLHNTVICVDGHGKIAKIDKAAEQEDVQAKAHAAIDELGWKREEVDWHVCETGQYFFPGFIGRPPHHPQ